MPVLAKFYKKGENSKYSFSTLYQVQYYDDEDTGRHFSVFIKYTCTRKRDGRIFGGKDLAFLYLNSDGSVSLHCYNDDEWIEEDRMPDGLQDCLKSILKD